MDNILDISDVEEFQYDQVDPEFEPVEYPSTSPEGVATIFHIADWVDPNHAWKNIQYSMGGGGIHLVKKSPYFGNIQVQKEKRDCLGIKACQFTILHLPILNIMRLMLNHDCGKELQKIKIPILEKHILTPYI